MSATIMAVGLNGMEGYRVSVEVNARTDKESFVTVGLPDASVKESNNIGCQAPSRNLEF